MSCLQKYQRILGLEVNYDKTALYRIGSLKKAKALLYTQQNIKWSDKLNILGVEVNQEEAIMLQNNYEPLLMKTRGILNNWRN